MENETEQTAPKKERPVRSDKSANEEIPHGTVSGYVYYACSCVKCRGAQAEYHRKRRQDRSQEIEDLRRELRRRRKQDKARVEDDDEDDE